MFNPALLNKFRDLFAKNFSPSQKTRINRFSFLLATVGEGDTDYALEMLKTSADGLTDEEAAHRLAKNGRNEIAHEKPPAWWMQLLSCFTNTFVVILLILGVVSYFTDDKIGALIIGIMVGVSVILRFWQEFRSTRAAENLKAMVRTTATVSRITLELREGTLGHRVVTRREIPMQELVQGDVIHLSAGDMIPADVRLLSSKDLFVSQSALTGESLPVEKYDTLGNVMEKSARPGNPGEAGNPIDSATLCFLGTNIVSGAATAVVVGTGSQTMFGSLAKNVLGQRALTSFDKGVNSVSWLLIRFM
ncbi:MAG TPA: cation-transporting P-type ATPase, partial [Opitutaceae bacterium]|nr:cation-transporting P-type ATPase [Opitutaceae bacterium]